MTRRRSRQECATPSSHRSRMAGDDRAARWLSIKNIHGRVGQEARTLTALIRVIGRLDCDRDAGCSASRHSSLYPKPGPAARESGATPPFEAVGHRVGDDSDSLRRGQWHGALSDTLGLRRAVVSRRCVILSEDTRRASSMPLATARLGSTPSIFPDPKEPWCAYRQRRVPPDGEEEGLTPVCCLSVDCCCSRSAFSWRTRPSAMR